MQRTASTTTAAAAVMILAGLAAILYGLARDEPPHSIAGLALTTIGLTAIALLAIRRWVTDTREERRRLAVAQREAQAEYTKYIAAQAAVECEHARLIRDLAAERAALAARLKAERAAMAAEFQQERDNLIAETMEATVMMHRGGKFAPSTTGNLIHFPQQHPQPERARSREHGVVSP